MSLTLQGIGKTVAGQMHLRDIDLQLAPGSFHVIVGRTLAGKTSLLRIIAGLDRPTSGQILLGDRDITRTSVRKRSVAMVYQQFVNYPGLSVYDNIASPMRLQKARDGRRRDKESIDARVSELAKRLHIEHLLDRRPGQLSGGQQQRLAIARALAKDAQLLLLDEPLVNLDYKLREELREELRAIFRAGSVTVLYATTEPAEAMALGGAAMVLHEGRLLQHAPVLDVYHRPANVAAARLFSDPPMNLFDVVVEDGRATIAGTVDFALPRHLRQLGDGVYQFGIRPRDCALKPFGRASGNGDGSGEDREMDDIALTGTVELNEISGSETFVYLARAGRKGAGDSPDSDLGRSFIVQEDGVFHHDMGAEVTYYLDPRRLIAFAGNRDEHGNPPIYGGELVASYARDGEIDGD